MIKNFSIKFIEWFQRRKKIILIVTSIIFWIAAIGYSIYLGDRLSYPDERWYFNEYAQNLAKLHMYSRDGVHPTAMQPPGYPLFLGIIVRLGFGVTSARLMNFLAMFVSIFSLYTLLESRSYKLASVLSVLMVLGYPVLFYTAGTLYPQTFGTLFFILAIMFYWKESFTTKNAFLAGACLGIAILVIPTFIFISLFLVFFSLFFRKDPLMKIGVLFVMTFVMIAPWTIRNYLTFNRFVPLSSNFGENFLIGNSPATTPNNGTIATSGITHFYEEAGKLGLDEFEGNEFYIQQALNLIREDPGHYIKLYLLKVINYFNFRNDLSTSLSSSLIQDLAMLLTYGVFLSMASIRILLCRQYPLSKLELFLILLYVCNAFVSAVVFTRIRFRLPFDYLLIAFVAIFLEKLSKSPYTLKSGHR